MIKYLTIGRFDKDENYLHSVKVGKKVYKSTSNTDTERFCKKLNQELPEGSTDYYCIILN